MRHFQTVYTSNIPRIFCIMLSNDGSFSVGIFALYLFALDFNVGHIGLLTSIYLVCNAAVQIPAGLLASRWGYKRTLFLGGLIYLIGMVLFATIPAGFFLWSGTAYALMGTGAALKQGVDVSLLYENARLDKRADNFPILIGRLDWWLNVVLVVCIVTGGLLYGFNIRWPFYAEVFLALLALGVTLFIKTMPDSAFAPLEREKGQLFFWGEFRDALHWMFSHTSFWKISIFSALIGSVALSVIQFRQPFLQAAAFPESWFGFIGALFFVSRGLGALWGGRLLQRYSLSQYLVVHTVLFSLSLLFFFFSPFVFFAVLMILVFFFLRGVYQPAVSSFLQKESPAEWRPVLLKINTLMLSLTSAITLFVSGLLGLDNALNNLVLFSVVVSQIFLLGYAMSVRRIEV